MPYFDSGSATHKGNIRDNNEDCFLDEPEQGLWLVADGMGGHEAGEVASAIVKDTILSSMLKNGNLGLAINAAHHAILSAVDNGIGATGMGSTVVAVHADRSHYRICWVGDSRAYLWSKNDQTLQQLSTDHSYVQMLVDSGAIRTEDMQNHPDKNIITQCLGSTELNDVKVDCIQQPWKEDEWLVLCSDGLSDEVDRQTIINTLSDQSNPKDAANALLNSALQRGGRDNITVQVIAAPKNIITQKLSFAKRIIQQLKQHQAVTFVGAVMFLFILYFVLG